MSSEMSVRVRGVVEAAERISSGAVTVHYTGSAVDLSGEPMLSRQTVPVIPERFDELMEAAQLLPRMSDAVGAVVEKLGSHYQLQVARAQRSGGTESECVYSACEVMQALAQALGDDYTPGRGSDVD